MLNKNYFIIRNLVVTFIYPFLIVLIAGWFLIPFTKAYLKEVIAFGLLSSVCFCITLLMRNQNLRKLTVVSLTLLLSILAFIKLSFYYQYGVKLSASALFVIFETNTTESAEFLKYYFSRFTIALAIMLFVPWILFNWFFPVKFEASLNRILRSKMLVFGTLVWIGSVFFIIHKKFTDQNILYTGFTSYSEYQKTKAILRNTLANKTSDFITVDPNIVEEQTYIVVIGESTSNWHMQLYGYNRETNPLLTEIKDELIIFEDVITPHVHTILALDKILTFSDYNEPNKKENASVVQLANQAGFTTYWLSSQRPVGFHESMSTIIANASDEKYFMATDNYTNTIYDEILLPQLDTILKQPNPKKMIFIHLIGTHSDYKKRYPERFQRFTGRNPRTLIQTAAAEKIVNEYDNAVLYNDFIIRNIIEAAKKENKPSYVLYFSDHGDDVFDTMDIIGHNEYHGTKPMYEVPFLAWLSKEYIENRPLFKTANGYSERRYNLEDFIHSFSDLSQINFNLYDRTRSIFSEDYKSRTRWIKKDEDFDQKK